MASPRTKARRADVRNRKRRASVVLARSIARSLSGPPIYIWPGVKTSVFTDSERARLQR